MKKIATISGILALTLIMVTTGFAAGKDSRVRVVHASPDAPAVDVTLTDGTVVFGNKSFKEFTAFTPLDAGSYDLEVRVAGTNTVALDLPVISIEAGKIYTVFAKGFLSGNGAQQQSRRPGGRLPCLYAITAATPRRRAGFIDYAVYLRTAGHRPAGGRRPDDQLAVQFSAYFARIR